MSGQDKHVRPKKLTRYFARGNCLSFGTTAAAYEWAARRVIASEFDALGWESLDDTASPALVAFRQQWCCFDMHGERWTTTQAYQDRLREIMAQLRAEDESA